MSTKTETQAEDTSSDAVIAEEDPIKLAKLSPKEAAIGAKLLPILTKSIAQAADARYAAQFRAQFDEMQATNTAALHQAIEDMRETAKPLSDEELAKLLGQEYGSFPVRLTGPDNAVTTFTIRELSSATEQRILLSVRAVITPVLALISEVEWKSLAGASQLERLDKVIALVPGALDVLCECVSVCLDPKGLVTFCTGPWVKDNMGMNRILAILTAQVAASRYRDFFSLVSRLFQQTRMTTR